MNSESIAKELEELERSKNATIKRLDDLMGQVQGEMVPLAAKWISDEVERRAKQYPAIIEKLGIDNVRKLKAEVKRVIDQLPSSVANQNSDAANWLHHQQRLETEFSRYTLFIDRIFARAISGIGLVLSHFQLLPELNRGDSPNGRWSSSSDVYQYAAKNPITAVRSSPAVREYLKVYDEFLHLLEQINKTRSELTKAKASELWEST